MNSFLIFLSLFVGTTGTSHKLPSVESSQSSVPQDFTSAPPSCSSVIQPSASYSVLNQPTLVQQGAQHPAGVNPQQPIILNSVQQQTTLHPNLPQSGSNIQPLTQNSTLPNIPALPGLNSSDNLPQPGSVLSTSLGQFTVVTALPQGYKFVNMDSTPVLHIADCDPMNENVLTGQVNMTGQSDKNDSTDGSVKTVKIAQMDMPKTFQDLINESPSPKPTTSKHKTPKGSILSQKKPPKKQKRFRNYSSPGHLSSAVNGSSPFYSPGLILSDETYGNVEEGKDQDRSLEEDEQESSNKNLSSQNADEVGDGKHKLDDNNLSRSAVEPSDKHSETQVTEETKSQESKPKSSTRKG